MDRSDDSAKIELPESIAFEIRRRIDRVKKGAPGGISGDGNSLLVAGSIGYSCFLSAEGHAYLEEYELDDFESVITTDRRAQILTLLLGSRTIPELNKLLPSRMPSAPNCDSCSGSGRVTPLNVLCNECHGLGWIESE